jgi:hypothetical protein
MTTVMDVGQEADPELLEAVGAEAESYRKTPPPSYQATCKTWRSIPPTMRTWKIDLTSE